jgi:hypothetical protein
MDEDLDRIRAERDALLEHDVETWLAHVRTDATSMRDFEQSLSYRVTKPLRWAGTFVRATKSEGLGGALAMSRRVVANRLRSK